jgi:predicted acetyltransferase
MNSAADQGHLSLLHPTPRWEQDYLAMAREFHAAGETGWPYGAADYDDLALRDFLAFATRCDDHRHGRDLPPGYVPASIFMLLDQERLVGVANLRHSLNEYLRNIGGHIGYCVRPCMRRRGYMKRFLPLVLAEAARLGIDQALITCEVSNTASEKVIRSAGGQFESERSDDESDRTVKRFWVDLADYGA